MRRNLSYELRRVRAPIDVCDLTNDEVALGEMAMVHRGYPDV